LSKDVKAVQADHQGTGVRSFINRLKTFIYEFDIAATSAVPVNITVSGA
jgi:hypothetical protein